MDDECGCQAGGCHAKCPLQSYGRHFFTKAERIEKLKNYADELRNELKAVEEKIKEMNS